MTVQPNVTNSIQIAPGTGKEIIIIVIAIIILYIIVQVISYWRIFNKAGRPGWLTLVPVVNQKVTFEIAGAEWSAIYLFNFAHYYARTVMTASLAEHFGKSKTWGIMMLGNLPFIGYPILAFGSSKYISSSAKTESIV
jgi:hypothetical protein